MIEIEAGSAAHVLLQNLLLDPGVTVVRIEERSTGVAVKANERMWTPTLEVTRC